VLEPGCSRTLTTCDLSVVTSLSVIECDSKMSWEEVHYIKDPFCPSSVIVSWHHGIV
jgi:hypothetical protein